VDYWLYFNYLIVLTNSYISQEVYFIDKPFNFEWIKHLMKMLLGGSSYFLDTSQYNKPGWTYVFFPDVKIGEWFAKYVAYAKENAIVAGYGDGNFRPGNFITRAEASKVAVKVLDMQ